MRQKLEKDWQKDNEDENVGRCLVGNAIGNSRRGKSSFLLQVKRNFPLKKEGILNFMLHMAHYEFNANTKTNWQAKRPIH